MKVGALLAAVIPVLVLQPAIAADASSQAVTVDKLASHTAIITTSPSEIPADTPVVVSATVTGSPGVVPTGLVEFKIGTRVMASSVLDGAGTATGSFLVPAPNPRKVYARYAGDAVYEESMSATTLSFTAQRPYVATLTTRLHFGLPNAVGAVRATILVTVTGVTNQNHPPTGTVTADSGFTCTALTPASPILHATARCSDFIRLGTLETVTITYSGDADFHSATTTVQVVNGGGSGLSAQ